MTAPPPHLLLPPGEGGAKRRMRGVRPYETMFTIASAMSPTYAVSP
jgi:hypothetical protein